MTKAPDWLEQTHSICMSLLHQQNCWIIVCVSGVAIVFQSFALLGNLIRRPFYYLPCLFWTVSLLLILKPFINTGSNAVVLVRSTHNLVCCQSYFNPTVSRLDISNSKFKVKRDGQNRIFVSMHSESNYNCPFKLSICWSFRRCWTNVN